MRKFLTGMVILFISVGNCAAQSTTLERALPYLENQIAENNLVGVYIAHITAEGEVSSTSLGRQAVDNDQEITDESLFEIGSITKVFTTLALAHLMKEKNIDLDATAESLLLDSFDLPEYEGTAITLNHLVTHTSGLPSLPDNLYPEEATNPYADYTLVQMKDYLQNTTLKEAPGTRFSYSNLGMGLLGHILAHQTGRSYFEVIETLILAPLGMKDTKIALGKKDSINLARGHVNGQGISNWDLPAFEAAGALRSSGNDMVKFLKAQMIISKSSLSPYIEKTQRELFEIEEGLSTEMDAIGMGWIIAKEHDPIVWHSGGTGGYRSFMGINMHSGDGALILSNSTANISDVFFHMLDEDYPLRSVQKGVNLNAAEQERLVGEYLSQQGLSFYVTTENGELFIRLSGQSAIRVKALSETMLVNNDVGAEFEFEMTDSDTVKGLELRQGGQTITAVKVSDRVEEQTGTEREIVDVPTKVLQQYVGRFQLAPGVVANVTLEDDQLFVQLTGQPKFPVFAETAHRFFYKVVEAEIEFSREDGDKKSSELTLYQSGQIINGQRISKDN